MLSHHLIISSSALWQCLPALWECLPALLPRLTDLIIISSSSPHHLILISSSAHHQLIIISSSSHHHAIVISSPSFHHHVITISSSCHRHLFTVISSSLSVCCSLLPPHLNLEGGTVRGLFNAAHRLPRRTHQPNASQHLSF